MLCLHAYPQLPCSPTKRRLQSGGGAGHSQAPLQACRHCGMGNQPVPAPEVVGSGQPGSAAASSAILQAAASSKPAAGSAGPARPQGDAEFERLLQQLNLNSSWRGMLMRSLEGSLQAAGGKPGSRAGCTSGCASGNQAAGALSDQIAVEPAAAAPAAFAAAENGKPAPAAAQPHGATPRIAARRSGTQSVAQQEPAVPTVCAAPALATADTMQHIIRRNKQLIQQQPQQQQAAVQAGAGAHRRSGSTQAVDADCRGPASVAAAALDDAEAILARLECRQWGAHSPSAARRGSGSSSSNGGGRRPAEAGAAPVAGSTCPETAQPEHRSVQRRLGGAWRQQPQQWQLAAAAAVGAGCQEKQGQRWRQRRQLAKPGRWQRLRGRV
jgi:hypothetical protein